MIDEFTRPLGWRDEIPLFKIGDKIRYSHPTRGGTFSEPVYGIVLKVIVGTSGIFYRIKQVDNGERLAFEEYLDPVEDLP